MVVNVFFINVSFHTVLVFSDAPVFNRIFKSGQNASLFSVGSGSFVSNIVFFKVHSAIDSNNKLSIDLFALDVTNLYRVPCFKLDLHFSSRNAS